MLQHGNGFITDRLCNLEKNTKINFHVETFEQEGRNALEHDKRPRS